MSSLDNIKAYRLRVMELTTTRFANFLVLFDEGVSLLIDASAILEATHKTTDHHTAKGASEAAAWRFLSTLPTSATWCFETALSGDYGIAKNIIRLTLEETVKLAYYITFPDKALRQVTLDRDKDEVDIADMLKSLEFEHRSGLIRLHGDLSTFYSHANLNLPTELIYQEQETRVLIGGGPRFDPDLFEPIVQQLLILVANALKYILIRFPSVSQNTAWLAQFEKYLPTVAEALPNSEEASSEE